MFLLETIISSGGEQPISSSAVNLGNDVAAAVQNVNWAAPSWDTIIVLFFLAAVFIYGVSLGRERGITILAAIYMALAVVTNAPYVRDLDRTWEGPGQYYAFKTLLFLATFVLIFFLVGRSAFARTFDGLASKWWQTVVFAICHVGLLLCITISFLPQDAIGALHPLTREVFASDNGRFGWMIVPILAMLLVKVDPDDDRWR